MTRCLYALAVALTLMVCAVSVPIVAQGQPNREAGAPEELDPLTDEEKAMAERLVRGDGRAAELLGDGALLASIEFLAIKGRHVRHADLLFSRPSGDFGARAIVQLGAKPQIVEFARIDARNVPMTQADIDEAWRIARADTSYIKRLGRRSVGALVPEALRIHTQDPSDPCFSGRCFYLIVRDGDFYVSDASVIVDLSSKKILTEGRTK